MELVRSNVNRIFKEVFVRGEKSVEAVCWPVGSAQGSVPAISSSILTIAYPLYGGTGLKHEK